MSIDPAALPDDIDALKRLIGELAKDAVAARAEIEKLRFQLARLKRAQFGRSSEKIDRTVEQLELAIETLDEDHARRIALSPLGPRCSRRQANKVPSLHAGHCPNIYRAKRLSIPAPAAVPIAAALCAGLAPT